MDPGRFVVAVEQASYTYYPTSINHTFDEILSSGRLRLIRDPGLKAHLSGYYAAFENERQWDDSFRRIRDFYYRSIQGVQKLDQVQLFEGDEAVRLITVPKALALRSRFLETRGDEWVPRLYGSHVSTERHLRGVLDRNVSTRDRIRRYLDHEA
jgi:hypothetical protein